MPLKNPVEEKEHQLQNQGTQIRMLKKGLLQIIQENQVLLRKSPRKNQFQLK